MTGHSATLSVSLDIDWAHDEVVRDALALLEEYDVAADWLLTHDSPVLGEVCATGHRVGLHPNFNVLLQSGATGPAEGAEPLSAANARLLTAVRRV